MGGIESLTLPWGWKDPRNTFTLPMWLRIFPEAKVVYIQRHGVDVAESLRVRALKGFASAVQKYEKYRAVAFLRPKLGGFVDSPRCASLEGGFELWKEYVDQGRAALARLPKDRVLTLSYEQLLEDPVAHLRASAAFCGLYPEESRCKQVAASIRSERARSYRSDPKIERFAIEQRANLAQRGYV
jgi:hypothetical protein